MNPPEKPGASTPGALNEVNMQIILASKSPRRQELLAQLGLRDFIIRPAAHEAEPDESLPRGEALAQVALQKALDVQSTLAGSTEDAVIIGADTMVCLGDRLLGKPADAEEAREMLRALSGNRHTVYTGLALVRGGRQLCAFEETDVYFRDLSEEEIESYLRREQVLDKAGAYAIQGPAGAFIHRIDGDYFNVVGLPLCRLGLMLREIGADIFENDIG